MSEQKLKAYSLASLDHFLKLAQRRRDNDEERTLRNRMKGLERVNERSKRQET